jgi:hypothetical protein
VAADDQKHLYNELAGARARVAGVERLADRLAKAGDSGIVPEGWLHHVDCAEAARAIRDAMAAAVTECEKGDDTPIFVLTAREWGAVLDMLRRDR